MNCLMQITSDRAVIHHAPNPFTLPKAVWNRRKSFWPGMGSMTGSAAENKGSAFFALNMPKTRLRMNRNQVCLSDNLCFDFAKHGRLKVPIRKLSPS